MKIQKTKEAKKKKKKKKKRRTSTNTDDRHRGTVQFGKRAELLVSLERGLTRSTL